jgi:hypothetical protein
MAGLGKTAHALKYHHASAAEGHRHTRKKILPIVEREFNAKTGVSRGALMLALLTFCEGLSQVTLDVGVASRAEFPCE